MFGFTVWSVVSEAEVIALSMGSGQGRRLLYGYSDDGYEARGCLHLCLYLRLDRCMVFVTILRFMAALGKLMRLCEEFRLNDHIPLSASSRRGVVVRQPYWMMMVQR